MSNLSPHAPLQVQASLRGKHLVVGGATGFVGKVWLSHLLQQVPDIGHITLLVRAKRGQSAAARWQHTLLCSPTFRWLRAQHGQALFAWMAERVTVREARLEAPRLGLDEASYRQLGDSADAVLNFAGLTDFEADPRAALQVNIEVAMALAKLAQASPARRLLHISTAYVRGNASGHVPESLAVGRDARGAPFDAAAELTWLRALCARGSTRTRRIEGARARAIEHGWPNIYTYSKALAEHLLAANGTLQLSIVRPTIVEGAHRFPLPGWNEGVNTSAPLVWLLSSTFCRFPAQPEHRFDVIPVDHVARGLSLILAAGMQEQHSGVFQLGSSDRNPLTFRRAIDLTALAARARHGQPDATAFERGVLRHLDAYPANEAPRMCIATQKKWAGRGADALSWLHRRGGPEPRLLSPHLRQRSMRVQERLRQYVRNLGRVEEMLRLYKPFVHDNDYLFICDRVHALSGRLQGDEADAFAFDITSIDWRHYWLKVQVPGLERWSLPLLYGERVWPDPPALGLPDATAPAATQPHSSAAPRIARRGPPRERAGGLTQRSRARQSAPDASPRPAEPQAEQSETEDTAVRGVA